MTAYDVTLRTGERIGIHDSAGRAIEESEVEYRRFVNAAGPQSAVLEARVAATRELALDPDVWVYAEAAPA